MSDSVKPARPGRNPMVESTNTLVEPRRDAGIAPNARASLAAIRSALPVLAHLEAELSAAEPVHLPAWTGSTVHGALGWALRELTCSSTCEARHAAEPDRCAFARLFGPGASRASHVRHAGMEVPALALRPAAPVRGQVLEPGRSWSFGVTLFGASALADARPILAALERLGERGLGRGRGRMRLVRAYSSGLDLWKNGRVLAEPTALLGSSWARWSVRGALRLRALTPLHLVRDGRTISTPRLTDLIASSLRRLVALSAVRGGGVPGVRLDELTTALGADVRNAVASWERFDTTRWSERQQRRHGVEGVVGEIWVPDVSAELASLLTWAAGVGLGKGTAMGLGRVEVTVVPARAEEVEVHELEPTAPDPIAPDHPAPIAFRSLEEEA